MKILNKKSRYIEKSLLELALNRNKMAFISGPRQVGKTTVAKQLIAKYDQASYKNWDESVFRRNWTKDPNIVSEDFDFKNVFESKFIILDEIHKSKAWKQKLKGLYDTLGEDLHICVTGSAHLNVFKKGGDSLMGRYFNFRLHPFSYGEVNQSEVYSPDIWYDSLFKKPTQKLPQDSLERLLNLGGFPEPYLSDSEKISRIWRRNRNEKIVREDLRDLTRITELSQVELLASLLPGKVGSPLSTQSLKEDLDVSYDTVARWLKSLKELYFFFDIRPWSKSIPRSLKKEPKIYMYDWAEVSDPAIRFENLIASHLLKACHFWTDTGEGDFQLHYIRNKEQQEIDFVLIKDRKPWLAIECKMNNTTVSENEVRKFTSYLKCPFIQVVFNPNIWSYKNQNLICSAQFLLNHLP